MNSMPSVGLSPKKETKENQKTKPLVALSKTQKLT
jgi:hypothetical protein